MRRKAISKKATTRSTTTRSTTTRSTKAAKVLEMKPKTDIIRQQPASLTKAKEANKKLSKKIVRLGFTRPR